MTSYGEITKIKVIDLKKLINFTVDNFFYWNSFRVKIKRGERIFRMNTKVNYGVEDTHEAWGLEDAYVLNHLYKSLI
jgi:hypothetical protein